MIKTKKQFEERLKELISGKNISYIEAINDVLELIENEGGCFKE